MVYCKLSFAEKLEFIPGVSFGWCNLQDVPKVSRPRGNYRGQPLRMPLTTEACTGVTGTDRAQRWFKGAQSNLAIM